MYAMGYRVTHYMVTQRSVMCHLMFLLISSHQAAFGKIVVNSPSASSSTSTSTPHEISPYPGNSLHGSTTASVMAPPLMVSVARLDDGRTIIITFYVIRRNFRNIQLDTLIQMWIEYSGVDFRIIF